MSCYGTISLFWFNLVSFVRSILSTVEFSQVETLQYSGHVVNPELTLTRENLVKSYEEIGWVDASGQRCTWVFINLRETRAQLAASMEKNIERKYWFQYHYFKII